MKGCYYLIAFALVGCLGIAVSTPFILDAAEKIVIQAELDKLEKLENQSIVLDQKEAEEDASEPPDPTKIDVVPNPFAQTEKQAEEGILEVMAKTWKK